MATTKPKSWSQEQKPVWQQATALNLVLQKVGLKAVCVSVCLPVRAEGRSWFLQRKISHAKIFNCELPVIPFSSIYRNHTTWERRDAKKCKTHYYSSIWVIQHSAFNQLQWDQSKCLDHKSSPDLWHTCPYQFCPPVWFFGARLPGLAHLYRWCTWFVLAGAAGYAEGDRKQDMLPDICQNFVSDNWNRFP